MGFNFLKGLITRIAKAVHRETNEDRLAREEAERLVRAERKAAVDRTLREHRRRATSYASTKHEAAVIRSWTPRTTPVTAAEAYLEAEHRRRMNAVKRAKRERRRDRVRCAQSKR